MKYNIFSGFNADWLVVVPAGGRVLTPSLPSFLPSFLLSFHHRRCCVYYLSKIESDMAASQRDFFSSSSPEPESPEVQSSLPAALAYVYLWVILFDYDENAEHPFDYYQVALFSDNELNPTWISGDLDQDSRMRKLKFSALPGKTFSLYAKVEKCKLHTPIPLFHY